MAIKALHIFVELSNVQCADFTAKEQSVPDWSAHRHMVNMVLSLLFSTPFCVCGYYFLIGSLEGFGLVFLSVRTLFTLIVIKGLGVKE